MRALLAASGNLATAILSPSARGMPRHYCKINCDRVGKIKPGSKAFKSLDAERAAHHLSALL